MYANQKRLIVLTNRIMHYLHSQQTVNKKKIKMNNN